MYRHEMSDQQVQRKDTFNSLLAAAGWDVGGWDEILESDAVNVSPEAVAHYENAESALTLEYHAAEDFVALTLDDGSRKGIRFRFHCADRLAEAVAVIIGSQEFVSRSTYMSLLQDLLEICPTTYADVDGELVKIEFEDEEE
jgi:hypothetical protein